jgi:hypothetical protein
MYTIKTISIVELSGLIGLVASVWLLVACANSDIPQALESSELPENNEEKTLVSPVSPISPIPSSSPTTAPSLSSAAPSNNIEPTATDVIEVRVTNDLVGEIFLNGKTIRYVVPPFFDALSLTGLTADEQYFWLANNETNSIFAIDPQTGQIVTDLPLPEVLGKAPNIAGLAWDGENFWLAEANTKTIYQYDANLQTEKNRFTISNHPGDLAWDGQALWVAVREGSRLQKWSIDGKLLRADAVPGTWITGLTWGANRLWYVDISERVVRYWDPDSAVAEVVMIDALAERSYGALGWQGNSLLLLNDQGGRLLSFDIEEFNFLK